MSKITIKDVARHAGVQPSTVSRAMNNHLDISPATKARVLDSIRELAYVPDRAARSFRTGKTRSISLILPSTGTEFYTRLINSIDETLEGFDYDAGIFPLLSERRLARYQAPSALPYHTDGLVFASLNPEHLYLSLLTIQGVPAVVCDVQTDRFDNVTVNNELGGFLAAQHLQDRPAETYVVNVEERFHTPFASGVFQQRVQGFRAAQQAAGLHFPEDHLYTCGFTLDSARAAAREVLEMRQGKVNIFTTCDLFAYGLVEEVKLAGLTLGDEVRVIGFDDEVTAQEIGLTTIRQPIEEMGRAVAQMLMDRIANPELPVRSLQFTPELQVRRTT